jgi:hypothetical protein
VIKDDLVLPRKINASNPDTFGRTAEEHSSDTYQVLLKMRARLNLLTAEVAALQGRFGPFAGLASEGPREIDGDDVSLVGTSPYAAHEDHQHPINIGPPTQGIGGGNLAGSGGALALANHDHTFRETDGPTDLQMGPVLDLEAVRRVGAFLIGRILRVLRRSANQSSTVVTPTDVSDLSLDLKALNNYLVLWVIYYTTAATTTGLRVGLHYSGTLNTIFYSLLGATGATAMQSEATATDDALLGQAGVGPGGTTRAALLLGMVRTTGAGTLSARFASGVAGSAVTVGVHSHMLVLQQ